LFRNRFREDSSSPFDILFRSIPFDSSRKKIELVSKINLAFKYVANYSDANITSEFNELKANAEKEFNDFIRKINTEIISRKNQDKKLIQELEEINKALEEKRDKQSLVEQGLIYAVYGMIGSLLLMFLALRLFHDDVAKEIIKRRSLIEVVGMAFMLITIIILGTGGKINTETLGTLLGTIAGYIFGRIGADRGGSSEEVEVRYIQKQPNKSD